MSDIVERQKFIDEWQTLSRQDDLFDHMVPSDFRLALYHISRADKENWHLREVLMRLDNEILWLKDILGLDATRDLKDIIKTALNEEDDDTISKQH